MKKYLSLFNIARVVAAVILLQTLYFKFTGHAESIALFTQIGMEPWGRIGVGIAELVVGLLLLFGRKGGVWLGALGGVVLMIGAVYFHITYIGVQDLLFVMALIVIICCSYLLRSCKSKESGDC